MIIKAQHYMNFKRKFSAGYFGNPKTLPFGQLFIAKFNLKSQDLGSINLDLAVLRGLSNRDAKKRIEFQLIDWTKDGSY